ncbi:outer membrane receptor for ferrienterochelin and colicins [Natronospira proteinivora]|uniref:Outer membrane receptor for ferrienterochelin and colicins n=1 Tax=Natronospira proteinivora TaxID=1807133 RepID=A0ABT1G8D7_9GAMM|nr:TonB-dependent receptor [Natronospira proteinivora]MCP1727581.1 outer membrane receptor for ferrienterochelin and colicins [Natronospira proteinivora]
MAKYPLNPRTLVCVTPLLVGLAMPLSSGAETKDDAALTPFKLDEITVTSTRTPRIMREVPIRTDIVDRETLDRQMSRDLADALRLLPGVRLTEIHGKQGEAVSIQGLDGDRVLVLVDGFPAAASTGSTVDVTQIAVADIERIEVIRGAQSALYGSEAMGGVINVITRHPTHNRARLEARAGSRGSVGEDDAPHSGQLQGNVTLGGQRLSGELTGDWRRDDGFSMDPSSYAQDRHQLEHRNLSGRFDWDLNTGTTLTARPAHFHEDKRQRLAVNLPGGREGQRIRYETVDQPSLQTGIQNRGIEGGWGLRSHWSDFENQVDERRPDGTLISRRESRIESGRVEGQWNRWVGDQQEWTVGGLVRQQRLSQQIDGTDEIPPGTRHDNQELFAQSSLFLSENLELLPGVRLQNDSDFGGFTSPSFNVLWARPGDRGLLNLRTGVGRGYRVPNLKERYFAFDQSDRGYMVMGNPELSPERSTSVQLGLEWLPDAPRAPQLDINLYHNRIRNLIATEFNPARSAEEGLQVFDYQNVGQASTRGVESSLRWSPWERWQLAFGYTWLDAEDGETGNRLVQRPRHHATSEVSYHHGAFQTSLSARYQSRVFIDSANEDSSPAWTRLRLRAQWTTEALATPLTLLMGVDNLLDDTRDFQDPSDIRPDGGRHIFLGLRLDWRDF